MRGASKCNGHAVENMFVGVFFKGGGGWILKKDKIPKCHAWLFHQTKIQWPNKKQDKWPFPVNTKHYHFPEVSSSKYGILLKEEKDQGWRWKETMHFWIKWRGYMTKRMEKAF